MTTQQLIKALQVEGTVAIIPTDTVYGIVARTKDKEAVQKLYNLKNREIKPGTIIATDIEQLVDLGLRRSYLVPFKPYWPNPLTFVIPTSSLELNYLHMGKNSLAVRITNDPFLQKIILKTGPLLSTSANPPGQATAQTIIEAKNYFKNKVDVYYDGGKIGNIKASTIVRIIDDSFEILRQGDYIFKP